MIVEQRSPLHLPLCQRWIGERIRAGGNNKRRGGASYVPSNLRQGVHVRENALEHLHPEQLPPERSNVAEWDRGRRQDGVEGRNLLTDEMVFGFCVE